MLNLFFGSLLPSFIQLQDFNYKHIFTRLVQNSIDSYQLASGMPADMNLYCFLKMEKNLC